MKQEFYYPSCGKGSIYACRWMPEGEIKGIVQIVHGIAEHSGRYEEFAAYLNSRGIAVVAEDHMGHGRSVGHGGIQGYFHGGWHAAVEDSYALMQQTMELLPGVPYILLGHSMGSFMARTLLIDHPDSGISGCILSGTAWQPGALLTAGVPLCKLFCIGEREQKPCPTLQNIVFGGYNKRIENPATAFDWISSDAERVEDYAADPLCGFVASGGLLRDMMKGLKYIQKQENLLKMDKSLPVLFAAGEEDPVGAYGQGVKQAYEAFKDAEMGKAQIKLYPAMRHEILSEVGREEVFAQLLSWMEAAWAK